MGKLRPTGNNYLLKMNPLRETGFPPTPRTELGNTQIYKLILFVFECLALISISKPLMWL